MTDSQLLLITPIGIVMFYTGVYLIIRHHRGKPNEHQVIKPLKRLSILFGIGMLFQLYSLWF